MINLYETTKDVIELEEKLEAAQERGLSDEELEELIDQLRVKTGDMDTVIDNQAAWIVNLEAELAARKDAEKKFKKRNNALKDRIVMIRGRLAKTMVDADHTKRKNAFLTISARKGNPVVACSAPDLPDQYLSPPTQKFTVDVEALGKLVDSGALILPAVIYSWQSNPREVMEKRLIEVLKPMYDDKGQIREDLSEEDAALSEIAVLSYGKPILTIRQ